MKKTLIIAAMFLTVGVLTSKAETPRPPIHAQTDAIKTTNGDVINGEGPIGTATALLLSLGAGTLAYKVRKNRKQE